ncbi:FAD-dependent oxidoreductase [Candidatus Saccharibacteria bacterium]|nr:FAD-dependent oxidoreductase [Candidatus Saccharibacteria bacterium]
MGFDVIIVGAGMAGLTSGIYLARAGKKALVLEGKVQGGQIINTLSVENWPGSYKVSGADLMKGIYNQALDLGVEVRFEEVETANKDGDLFKVVTDESEYEAKAVVVAVGAEPRKLSELQTGYAGNRPISYCATCDGALYKDKPVVVVGSGNTAKDEIKYLEGICSKVYQIHHDEPIPEDAEAVFVAIGRVPSTGFLKDLVELDEHGYVVAGEDCKTSCPGVFVAGDCRTKEIRQLVTAAGDGAVAAEAVIKYLG